MTSARVVLVTGCSSGVGAALAVSLASSSSSSYVVFASMRDVKKDQELKAIALTTPVIHVDQSLTNVQPGTIYVLPLDVTSDSSVESAFAKLFSLTNGRIDVLVNNAGFTRPHNLEQSTLQEHRDVFETNYFGVVRCSKAAIPTMRKQKNGHIINITSIGGVIGQAFNEAYCAAKFAVEGLSESAAVTLKPHGVNVSLIEPGAIRTSFVANSGGTVAASSGVENPYQRENDKYLAYITKMFSNEALSQSSAQVADFIVKECIESPQPNVRYQTSDFIRGFIGQKIKDLTGEMVKSQIERFGFNEPN